MKSKEKISIIIPCFNQAHFLGDAIESVLAQTHRHREIIVVNDGSTDNTSEVAAKYRDVRTVTQPNQGLSAARNTGLRESTGDYLVFLDADDRLSPEALRINLQCLRDRPECAFATGSSVFIAANGSPIPTPKRPVVKENHYLTLLKRNITRNPATVMFRRSVFAHLGGFDTSVNATADYDMYLRIAREFPIYCHDEVVAEYRKHGENMSQNSTLMLKSVLSVLRSQWKYVKGKSEYEQAYRSGIANWQDKYGDMLANEIRAHVHAGDNWERIIVGVLNLARYNPRGLITHLTRRISCVISNARS